MIKPLNIFSKIRKVSSEEAEAGILGTQGARSKNCSWHWSAVIWIIYLTLCISGQKKYDYCCHAPTRSWDRILTSSLLPLTPIWFGLLRSRSWLPLTFSMTLEKPEPRYVPISHSSILWIKIIFLMGFVMNKWVPIKEELREAGPGSEQWVLGADALLLSP